MIKLFEELFHKRMLSFFPKKNKLFSPTQFDFRSKRSCTHSISTLTEQRRTQIDNKLSRRARFFELKKGFDSIDQHVLLKKLYAYGFRGTSYDLIDD